MCQDNYSSENTYLTMTDAEVRSISSIDLVSTMKLYVPVENAFKTSRCTNYKHRRKQDQDKIHTIEALPAFALRLRVTARMKGI